MYTNKPIIFLEREEQAFNEAGRKVKELLYGVNGDDYDELENILIKMLEQDDIKKSVRDIFYNEYLDYTKETNMLASDSIAKDLVETLLKKESI